MKYSILVLLFFSGLLMAACSSDDDNGPSDETSSVSFTVAGDIEAEKSGVATASVTQVGQSNLFSIVMSNGANVQQTFTLSFFSVPGSAPVDFPEPGDYAIGSLNQADYWLVYTDLTSGDPFVEYGLTYPVSGTLTITSSTENWLEGEFQFQAEGNEDTLGNPQGMIVVTEGEFRAVKER